MEEKVRFFVGYKSNFQYLIPFRNNITIAIFSKDSINSSMNLHSKQVRVKLKFECPTINSRELFPVFDVFLKKRKKKNKTNLFYLDQTDIVVVIRFPEGGMDRNAFNRVNLTALVIIGRAGPHVEALDAYPVKARDREEKRIEPRAIVHANRHPADNAIY